MNIVLAVDGSEYSDCAAQFLTRLKFSPNDTITIVHAVGVTPVKEGGEPYYSLLKRIKVEIAPRIVESAQAILGAGNARISTKVIDDYPDAGIIGAARDLNADLIVMGARGLKGIRAVLLGSITRSVAINSPNPVLVIKPPQQKIAENLRILLASDGSDDAREVARFLAGMPFDDATEITVLRVIQSGLDIPEKFHLGIDTNIKETATRIRSMLHETSEKSAAELCEFLCDRFNKVDRVIKDGDAAMEILSTAAAVKASLIAVGSRGMRGVKGMLGSVSRYVLSRSECSILIGKSRYKDTS